MARFVFVVPPLTGHVNPTVAMGAALAARGHTVAWVGHPTQVRPLLPEGACLLALSEDVPQALVAASVDRRNKVRGLAAFKFLWDDFLLPLARGMVPEVEEAVRAFAPDVLVSDQQTLAGAIVARRLGLRWATTASTSAAVVDPLAALPKIKAWRDDRLHDLAREAGLPLAEEPDRSPHLVLVCSTRALVGEDETFPAHYAFVGPAIRRRPEPVPFPWESLAEGRRVLVSLGTLNAERGGPFFRAVVQGLAGVPVQVVLVAPEDVAGPLPPNVLRRDYVPQLELLGHIDAVISHGGHNTVCETLLHGRPLVVAPIKDDQPVVARQVVDAGAGVRVRFGRATGPVIREAVTRVLDDPGFAAAARRIGDSFRAAGGAEAAADRLEALAAE